MKSFWRLRGKTRVMVLLKRMYKAKWSLRAILIASGILLSPIVYVVFSALYTHLQQSGPSTPMTYQKSSLFSSDSLVTSGRLRQSTPSLPEGLGMPSSIRSHSRLERSSQALGRTAKNGPVSNGKRKRFRK